MTCINRKLHGRTGRGVGGGGRGGGGNIRFTVGPYWLIIKINGTHFVNFLLSNRNFS